MTDFFIKQIPLPLPRPLMEEVVPGGVNPGIRLDIPFPDMSDIDLSYPKVGLDYLLQPWYWLTRALGEVSSMDWLILSLAVLSIYSYVRLAMWFDKRYRKNDWM